MRLTRQLRTLLHLVLAGVVGGAAWDGLSLSGMPEWRL
jgi:hypothetical protein